MLTWVEIKTRALENNIYSIKKKLSKNTALFAVIKANAYGHDMLTVARVCEKSKHVAGMCVVSVEEALLLRSHTIHKPILVLAIYDLEDKASLRQAIVNKVSFPIFTWEQAKVLQQLAKQENVKVNVHIKVDTGASRIGFLPKEALLFGQKMCSLYPNLTLEGIFSHFASSESDKVFTSKQLTAFDRLVENLTESGVARPKFLHIACSAAVLKNKFSHLTAVRTGINLYGLHSVEKGDKLLSLTPVLSWYTTVIQTKIVPAGTSVSYGRTFICKKPTTLAVLPIGYYDGYDRRFSNKAFVIIKGNKCRVLGRVCMNLTVVDATTVRHIKVGDHVTLVGKQKGVTVDADTLAHIAQTINYEIVTRIGHHIPRILS